MVKLGETSKIKGSYQTVAQSAKKKQSKQVFHNLKSIIELTISPLSIRVKITQGCPVAERTPQY